MPKNSNKVILYTKSSVDECVERIEGLVDMVERPILEEMTSLLGRSPLKKRLRGCIKGSRFWIGKLRHVHIKGRYFRPVFKGKLIADNQGGTRIEGYCGTGFVTNVVHLGFGAVLAFATIPGFANGIVKVLSGNLRLGLPYMVATPIAWACFFSLIRLAKLLDRRDQVVLVEYVRRKLGAERVSIWRL